MRKISKYIIIMFIFIIIFSSTCCEAAWWGTPGYEWALKQKLISTKSQKQLNEYVSTSDVYDIVLRYLKLKRIDKQDKVITREKPYTAGNPVVYGVFKMIDAYTAKTELTRAQYREVNSLITHARNMIQEQKAFIVREDLKDMDLYLALSRYRAVMLIQDYEGREYELAKIDVPKNSEIISYGVTPYAGEMTRREFLIMMYRLLVSADVMNYNTDKIINPTNPNYEIIDVTENDVYAEGDAIIKEYNVEGVLIGYNDDLMLEKRMTYAEMCTFLHRFEIVDFNPILIVEEEEEDTKK